MCQLGARRKISKLTFLLFCFCCCCCCCCSYSYSYSYFYFYFYYYYCYYSSCCCCCSQIVLVGLPQFSLPRSFARGRFPSQDWTLHVFTCKRCCCFCRPFVDQRSGRWSRCPVQTSTNMVQVLPFATGAPSESVCVIRAPVRRRVGEVFQTCVKALSTEFPGVVSVLERWTQCETQ